MDYRNHESAETLRNKCEACFRQFIKKEHLVEHMKTSFHSVHEPICGVCKKHCRSFESLREHLTGSLPKPECKNIFNLRGCKLCLTVLDSPNALRYHRDRCQLSGVSINGLVSRFANMRVQDDLKIDNGSMAKGSRVVALGCKMVGGGSDGSLDLCARVCIVDQYENVLFHSYVKPPIPITNYRYESPELIREAMPLRQVQQKIQEFLCNGEPTWKVRPGGRARVLVGHGLDHDLNSLHIDYPSTMLRDTSKYPPLVKSNKLSDSLRHLTQTYLGYDIQPGSQQPYEDAVAAMRLYMRMRSQGHEIEECPLASDPQNRNNFASRRQSELERMSPRELLAISRSDYYCWCLDSVYV